MNSSPRPQRLAIWTRRLALASFVLTLLLVAIGGQVTTIGAGMAVKGWWTVEGSDGTWHFLPLFPGHEWGRDVGTFYEHTHRMLGMTVGVAAIATVVLSVLARRARQLGRGVVRAAVIALVAIVLQGVIGGTRVLEDSAHLAFLHGVTGQITFCFVGFAALASSSAWQEYGPGRTERAPSTLARVLAVATLVQITVGAWYRHGLRNPELEEMAGALHMHMAGAFAVLGLVIAVALRTTLFAREVDVHEPRLAARLVGGKKRLHALVGTQILLGFFAWMFYGDPDYVSAHESIAAGLHLVVGALLLLQCVALVLWIDRARANEVAA
jgi:cytochrome c oxidase assembly protein subunit 15